MKIFQIEIVCTDKPTPHGNHQAGRVQLVRDFLRQNGFLTEIGASEADAFSWKRCFVVLDACDATTDNGLHHKYAPKRMKEVRVAAMSFFDGKKNIPCGVHVYGHWETLQCVKAILEDDDYRDHIQNVGSREPAKIRRAPTTQPPATGRQQPTRVCAPVPARLAQASAG